MKNRILSLTLQKKWFDMILSKEKKEEYREVKDHWMTRIARIKGCGTGYNFNLLALAGFNEIKKAYSTLIFLCLFVVNSPFTIRLSMPNLKDIV